MNQFNVAVSLFRPAHDQFPPSLNQLNSAHNQFKYVPNQVNDVHVQFNLVLNKINPVLSQVNSAIIPQPGSYTDDDRTLCRIRSPKNILTTSSPDRSYRIAFKKKAPDYSGAF